MPRAYNEPILVEWRTSSSDPYIRFEAWATVEDTGTQSFDTSDGAQTVTEAYQLRVRHGAIPDALRAALRDTQTAFIGFTARCRVTVRGKQFPVEGIRETDGRRRRETILTLVESGS